MKKHVSLILVIIMLLACSGCFWGWDNGRGGHDQGRYRGQDRGDHSDHR